MKDHGSSSEDSYLLLKMQPSTDCSEARVSSNELLAAKEPTVVSVHTKLSQHKDLHCKTLQECSVHSAQLRGCRTANQVDAIHLIVTDQGNSTPNSLTNRKKLVQGKKVKKGTAQDEATSGETRYKIQSTGFTQ
ncbi:hypothetical protein STEG23_037278 [Scotinomys teguina]